MGGVWLLNPIRVGSLGQMYLKQDPGFDETLVQSRWLAIKFLPCWTLPGTADFAEFSFFGSTGEQL